MFESPFAMPRQKRPPGRAWPIDDTWKKNVLQEMTDQGIDRAELCRRVHERFGYDLTQSALTVLFRATTKTSRLVPWIEKILGLVSTTKPAPAVKNDPRHKRYLAAVSLLNEQDYELVVSLAEKLARRP